MAFALAQWEMFNPLRKTQDVERKNPRRESVANETLIHKENRSASTDDSKDIAAGTPMW
jgi:hypothetical protein